MRISRDNLKNVMRPYAKWDNGDLCIGRGSVDSAIRAISEAYGNEGCTAIETNENGRDFLVVYAADKNHLRKVKEYYIKEKKGAAKTSDKMDIAVPPKEQLTPQKIVEEKHKEPITDTIKGESFEIIKQLGVLSETEKGWKKELNLISWYGKEPKYDIRDWSPYHDKMSKGIVLTEEEIKALKSIL